MSLAATAADEDPAAKAAAEIHLPAEIDWEMLDKSRFFLLGAVVFSGVSAAFHPVVLLKTRIQISDSPASSLRTAATILRHEGLRGLYRGLGTSITGTVPARTIYMASLEITKSRMVGLVDRLGLPDPAAAAVSSAAAGLIASLASQVVWTPVDVVSQRLMVQGCDQGGAGAARYCDGADAFRKILMTDGLRGLYRGFGVAVLTYAPSSTVCWGTFTFTKTTILSRLGHNSRRKGGRGDGEDGSGSSGGSLTPDFKTMMLVQATSAMAGGAMAALVTMPLDTIKTRMQVIDVEDGGARGKKTRMTVLSTVRSLMREGGWRACYRGLGPRWANMSLSAATMITTYEFLKRISAKSVTE